MDYHFSEFLINHHSVKTEVALEVFQALEQSVVSGSTCLDLALYATKSDTTLQLILESLDTDGEQSVVSSACSNKPLVKTEHNLLYYQRYIHYEITLSERLIHLARDSHSTTNSNSALLLEQLFPQNTAPGFIDQQKIAAETVLKKNLLILSGGPGTGKTTTIVKILTLLKSAQRFTESKEVLLLAPTGKAAHRLNQSIASGIQSAKVLAPQYTEEIESLPTEASTIHRALGLRGSLSRPKYNGSNPFKQNIFIIDETSMVDLTTIYQLFSAIPKGATVILTGDQNQLSSVQVGTVMADLIETACTKTSPIHTCYVQLTHTYRNAGTIKQACDLVCAGSSELVWDTLANNEADTKSASLPKNLKTALQPLIQEYWIPHLKNNSLTPLEKLRSTDQFKILCPTRHGNYGVHTVNSVVESILADAGITQGKELYPGKSILITKNDYENEIFNGDIAILTNNESVPNEYLAVFDKEDEKSINTLLLPKLETAWALTIHKTQGSEYDTILLILDSEESLQKGHTRELIYTAISRAKSKVIVWSDKDTFESAVGQTIQRASGLAQQFINTD